MNIRNYSGSAAGGGFHRISGIQHHSVKSPDGEVEVSARAREQVMKAALELGDVASSSAYPLATGKSKDIGVAMLFINRWYFSNLLENAFDALVSRGYDVFLNKPSGGAVNHQRILKDSVLRERADGAWANSSRQEFGVLGAAGHFCNGDGWPSARGFFEDFRHWNKDPANKA